MATLSTADVARFHGHSLAHTLSGECETSSADWFIERDIDGPCAHRAASCLCRRKTRCEAPAIAVSHIGQALVRHSRTGRSRAAIRRPEPEGDDPALGGYGWKGAERQRGQDLGRGRYSRRHGWTRGKGQRLSSS